MNLKKIKDTKASTKPTNFEELKNKFLEEYEKNEPESEPSEDGTLVIDYQTGELLGFTISNWGWSAGLITKYAKLAKSLGLKFDYNGQDDLTILSEKVGDWMSKTYETLSKLSDQIDDYHQTGKKPKVKILPKDFETFKRWSKLTGYKKFNDYGYNDIEEYLKSIR